jgi:hypothetical protein
MKQDNKQNNAIVKVQKHLIVSKGKKETGF